MYVLSDSDPFVAAPTLSSALLFGWKRVSLNLQISIPDAIQSLKHLSLLALRPWVHGSAGQVGGGMRKLQQDEDASIEVVFVLVFIQVQVAVWSRDLKEVSLSQTQLSGEVLAQWAQRVFIPEQRRWKQSDCIDYRDDFINYFKLTWFVLILTDHRQNKLFYTDENTREQIHKPDTSNVKVYLKQIYLHLFFKRIQTVDLSHICCFMDGCVAANNNKPC